MTSILLSRRFGSLSLSLVASVGIVSEGKSHCAFFPSSSSSSKDNKTGDNENKTPFDWANKHLNDLKNMDTNALTTKATQLINAESTVQVSYGFLVGYGAGFVLKRITRGKLIACPLSTLFLPLFDIDSDHIQLLSLQLCTTLT